MKNRQHYLLTALSGGHPKDMERETLSLLHDLHPLGGYIVSSSNMLTDYVKPENFLAMSRCVRDFYLPD